MLGLLRKYVEKMDEWVLTTKWSERQRIGKVRLCSINRTRMMMMFLVFQIQRMKSF